MGRISKGVLGGFSGKIGNVVGGSWKGIDYMRIKPSSVANPKTVGQVDQRTKFTASLQFLQPLKDFVKVGYKNFANKMTEFNSAMSYTLGNAITGISPDFIVDYSSALLSRGSLPGALNPSATSTVAGAVEVAWDDNTLNGTASATDKSLIALYNPNKAEAVYTLEGASRSAGTETLVVPANYSGDDLEAYISFQSADGTSVSNSIYIGSVTVA
ncbi:MAG: hypothetical protein KKE39_14755 [Bacteroidetes bacterium]|nr:hypothetical protein [Bacteroidota bacterium]MBU1371380.1 hypothetical protein [Bacteroidota bacterium]MBU1485868.1 hypothetical protein [Bacteroidota bacterium]MBU1761876.1 hypothetical protein [Bacteroidota bacterium]MBU2045731.1 hypothetical protein [Bacteroidota bacterium]